MRTPAAALTLASLFAPPSATIAADAPVVLRSTEHRYSATQDDKGDVQRGDCRGIRIEHRDQRGRIIRWQQCESDGTPSLTWFGVYYSDSHAPDRAAYLSSDKYIPLPELCVTSPDASFQDVLYGNVTEKPRRQLRQYFDIAGREIYQEYFSPLRQEKYSEEFYLYDDQGNELGRTWQRLDGKARRDTRFQIRARNEHGHWTSRLVYIDDKLESIDEREIVYGTATRPHPPASAGPVEPSTDILPIPVAPGIISSRAAGENSLTFSPDGNPALFTRYEDDWTTQRGYISTRVNGVWTDPGPVPFTGDMYNMALSEDGQSLIFCRHEASLPAARVFIARLENGGWSDPVDLTDRDGIMGSYFRLLANGTLYFHREGDLFSGALEDGVIRDIAALPAPINTRDGVEFGAWIDSDESRIIFTRSVEDAPELSGLFVAFRDGEGWTEPGRLPLPYGWSPVVSPDGEDFVYTVDDEIMRVPIVQIASWIEEPGR